MSGRYLTPIPGRIFATFVAATTLAAWQAAPAFASSNVPPPCDDAKSTALEIPDNQLHATSVSHELDARSTASDRADESKGPASPTRYLTPEAEATLREFFEDAPEAVDEPPAGKDPVSDSKTLPAIKARVPGISEGDLARYKRHMYRRDI